MDTNQKKDIWQLYMYMLRCAITKERMNKSELDAYERCTKKDLIHLVVEQNQIMLLYQQVEAYQRYLDGQVDIYLGISAKPLLLQTMREYEKYKIIRCVFEEGRKQEIPFVVFKGIVLADLYPQYVERSSCDTDLYIPKEKKEDAVELLLSLGYRINEEHVKNEVTVFENEQYDHKVELHTCLWEDFRGRRMDLLDSYQLTSTSHLIEMKACGIHITTLGYEDHLIYQMFHIIKHFSLEGVGCKYLADITLYINRYKEQINFDDFWKKMEQLGYTKFCYYFFTICIEFLGMDSVVLGEQRVEMGKEYYAFISDLMKVGLRENGKEACWQIMGMMTPYFTGERHEKTGNALVRKLQVMFPRPKDLPDDLMYARKCPVLLPIAWIHKMGRYLIKRNKHRDDWYSASEKLNVAEKRIALMSDMGLLDE